MALLPHRCDETWGWIPDPQPLFRRLIGPTVTWSPSVELHVDSAPTKFAIADAIDARCEWLRHPCMSRLTAVSIPNPLVADLNLISWVAGHAFEGSNGDLGSINVPRPLWLWTADGGTLLSAGRHSLAELGRRMRRSGQPEQPVLDLWSRSIGFAEPGTWAAMADENAAAEHADLASHVVGFLAVLSVIQTLLPEVMNWLSAATKVVLPLIAVPGKSQSSHRQDVFGTVYAQLDATPSTLVELVVHETAHLHLRAADAGGCLVKLDHTDRYPSPLRKEPRPLFGVLLAFHALAYITAALTQAQGLLGQDVVESEDTLAELRKHCKMAETTVLNARGGFTAAGLEFVEQTLQVAGEGRG